MCDFPPLLLLFQVEIAPPLLGKFQSLVLDNRDLAGLARCLSPDDGGGDQGPNNTGGSGGGFANNAQQQQQQQRDRPQRSDFLPLSVADMNSGYNNAAGRLGSGGGGGGDRSPPRSCCSGVVEHTLPLDSPCDNSLFSFGSTTSIAEDEVGCVYNWPAYVHTFTHTVK